jgi:hypothetical protein
LAEIVSVVGAVVVPAGETLSQVVEPLVTCEETVTVVVVDAPTLRVCETAVPLTRACSVREEAPSVSVPVPVETLLPVTVNTIGMVSVLKPPVTVMDPV